MVKTASVNTHKTNMEKVRKRIAETATDNRWLGLKDGDKKKVRILPPWGESAEGSFYFEGALHYGFKIGGQNRAMACPQYLGKGECPVCMFLDALEKQESDEESEITRSKLRQSIRRWVNVLERESGRFLIFGGSRKFVEELVAQADEDEYGDFTDPDSGHDAMFSRTGKGMYDTKYRFRLLSEAKPIGVKGWQKNLYQLDKEVLEWFTLEEMIKHLKANYGESLAELGMTFNKLKSSSKKKAKPVEEEPEEDEEEELEETEEPEEKDDEESESEIDADTDEDEIEEEDSDDDDED